MPKLQLGELYLLGTRPIMSATNSQSIFVASILVMSFSGCDVTVHDCEKEPEAKVCQDDEADEDAGDVFDDDDASVDAGSAFDGGRDASTGREAGLDSGKDATISSDSSVSLTVDEFCVAQLATAVAWRDALVDLCGPTIDLASREKFLQSVLAYDATIDFEGKCIDTRQAAIKSGNTVFDATNAQACADAYNKNFAPPPDPFPTAGIDLAKYRAIVAHGAPALVQIPICRSTFKGKLTRGKTCTDHFECIEGLRCLDAPGGTKACETALIGGTCLQTSQCADGYTCVGSTEGGGKTCVKNSELPLNGGNCTFPAECAEGLDCISKKCANPVAEVICK